MENSNLSKFLLEYGSQWIPGVGDLDDEYGCAYLAKGLVNGLEHIIADTQVSEKFPELIVRVVILMKADTRCFVWRDASNKYEYILAINYGTFANISSQLSDENIWIKIFDKAKYVNKLDRRDFYRLVNFMVINSFAYHELMHIIRGHFGYRLEGINISEEESVYRKKICEVDADKWSSYVLGGEILSHSKLIAQVLIGNEKSYPLIATELLEILSIALYRCFAVYNHPTVRYSSLYPHPLIRATRIAVSAGDNIERGDIDINTIFSRLNSVLNGLAYAEENIEKEFGVHQKSWDLGAELVAFESNYSSALKDLEKNLIPFVPR